MKASICLNMIIRNESRVIARCLESVLGVIDSWVIVDTGSTDGTPALVKTLLQGIPGQLLTESWRDFGSNRNSALTHARRWADFALVVDADEELIAPSRCVELSASVDGYVIEYESTAGICFQKLALVRTSSPWIWKGRIHEALVCRGPNAVHKLEGFKLVAHFDSARNQQGKRKYERDARILQRITQQEPTNARAMFYLAQSLRSAGCYLKAEHAYVRRLEMGGSNEELWYATYQLGLVRARLKRPLDDSRSTLLRAATLRPARAEPLWALAVLSRQAGRYRDALSFARRAARLPQPVHGIFVEGYVYQWAAATEHALAEANLGNYAKAIGIYERLLESRALPVQERQIVQSNRAYCIERAATRSQGTAVAESWA